MYSRKSVCFSMIARKLYHVYLEIAHFNITLPCALMTFNNYTNIKIEPFPRSAPFHSTHQKIPSHSRGCFVIENIIKRDMPTCMSLLLGVPCKTYVFKVIQSFRFIPVAQVSHDNNNSHTDQAGCFLRLFLSFCFLIFCFCLSASFAL